VLCHQLHYADYRRLHKAGLPAIACILPLDGGHDGYLCAFRYPADRQRRPPATRHYYMTAVRRLIIESRDIAPCITFLEPVDSGQSGHL